LTVSPDTAALLELTEVRFGFAARPAFLGPISLSVRGGECWAIVGPNGAGKSTLLKLMVGLYRPVSGEVRIRGAETGRLSKRARARAIAYVPQSPPADLEQSVRDIVLMGRFPHRSMGLFESVEDYRAADRAMAISGTLEFADRPIATLSGGEAQRVHVAAALAQEPELLLLDEPTASLDLRHQLAIFEVLMRRASTEGLGVVIVTHDVNLAAGFCSKVLLLDQGRCVATGSPEEVLTPEVLGPVYGVEMLTLSAEGKPSRRWIVPVRKDGEGDA
jgi:iron complex transport system ATP-binding protein